MPELSIILPTYNGAKFLRPQIDSILAQTAGDFELIAIDDGSNDDTVAILDDYARRDRRVRRLPSTGNAGQNQRLAQLVMASTGTFVAIADQDDIWKADRNARLLAAIGDRALACGRSQLIDADGRDLGMSILDANQVDPTTVGPLAALFVPFVSGHAAIMRRSWMNLGGFFSPVPFDMALGLEALFSTGLIYVDGAVVQHRIHGANQMNGNVLKRAIGGNLVSRYRWQKSFSHVSAGRLAFYLKLEFLGRSAALDRSVRAMAGGLSALCGRHWFGAGGSATALERDLHEVFDPFATSSFDATMFAREIVSLTRASISPVNLRRAWKLYRTG